MYVFLLWNEYFFFIWMEHKWNKNLNGQNIQIKWDNKICLIWTLNFMVNWCGYYGVVVVVIIMLDFFSLGNDYEMDNLFELYWA